MSEWKRVVLDCRQNPRAGCTLCISGSESEVLDAAEDHVIRRHGLPRIPALRDQLKRFLKEEAFAR
jgi:hypothetical protein